MRISFNEEHCYNALNRQDVDNFIDENGEKILSVLRAKVGWQDFIGWYNIADTATEDILSQNSAIANEIREVADAFVVIGVGGSNRTALSLIEGLKKSTDKVEIFYGGNNLSSQYLIDLLDKLKDKNVYIDVIAKDFNTLEPGLAFRMFRKFLKSKYGDKYNNRVILTGSYGKGQLAEIAERENMRFLPFPKPVGGRFSAFTSVTFLPAMVAGINVDLFVKGGMNAEKASKDENLKNNIAVRYAVCRYLLQEQGFTAQNLVYFEPRFENFCRWALQLQGESEGKNGRSVLPFVTTYSEDLHAIGQFIQEGRKFLFETMFDVRIKNNITIEEDELVDNFDYLNDIDYDNLNSAVLEGSRQAHYDAGVPVMTFVSDGLDEEIFGEFMYTFMMSTYISAILIDVEPFDQPGVEDYKKNMYKILGK